MSRPVEVVIPYSHSHECLDRFKAWEHLRRQWANTERYTVWRGFGPDPWVKARAVMPIVAENVTGDVVVMADADVWVEPDAIDEAVSAVRGGAAWAVPHSQVFRLTRSASEAYRNGGSYKHLPLDQPPYIGIEGCGITVVRREVMLQVPLDPLFVGWG